MLRLRVPLLLAALTAVLLAACDASGDRPGGDGELRDGPFKLLVYTRTEGFRHPSIPFGILAIQTLGQEHGFEVDTTEDPAQFNIDNLAQYELVVFLNTTLDVLPEPAQRDAFENFVRGGGGFVGVHAAADTLYDWPFYGELVGAWFLTHPVLNQPGELRIEDTGHPSTAHLSNPWFIPLEEYYSFQTNPRGAVRVLMNIDEDSYDQAPNTSCDPSGPTFPEGYSGTHGDHPMSWCHDKFAGRAWYTALGHEPHLYALPDYRDHLLNGILTAARRVPASCAVNEKPDDVPPFREPELRPCQEQLPGP